MRKVAAVGEAGYPRIERDNYRTPDWVTAHLLRHVDFAFARCDEVIWEPAAGQGDMVDSLNRHLPGWAEVVASDINGFRGSSAPADFLSIDTTPIIDAHLKAGLTAIITNPPYDRAEDFIRRALAITEAGYERHSRAGRVAMLLGHDYDTALTLRGDLFRHPAFYGALRLGKRIQWVGLKKKASPRQIHDWFIWSWNKDPAARPVIIYPEPT